jgi:hypothetical protein
VSVVIWTILFSAEVTSPTKSCAFIEEVKRQTQIVLRQIVARAQYRADPALSVIKLEATVCPPFAYVHSEATDHNIHDLRQETRWLFFKNGDFVASQWFDFRLRRWDSSGPVPTCKVTASFDIMSYVSDPGNDRTKWPFDESALTENVVAAMGQKIGKVCR